MYLLFAKYLKYLFDVLIVWQSEQEQSWDVVSQSLTSSTNTPEKVTRLVEWFISINHLILI